MKLCVFKKIIINACPGDLFRFADHAVFCWFNAKGAKVLNYYAAFKAQENP